METIRSSATYFIHLFITWVMPDAGDPEMNKAQGSQSKWGESVNEDVITVWLGVAARARNWWTQRAGHFLCGKASAKKVTLAFQDTFLHCLIITTASNRPFSEEKGKVFVFQFCSTFCDPDSYRPVVNCILPGSSVHGIPGENTGMGCHSFL